MVGLSLLAVADVVMSLSLQLMAAMDRVAGRQGAGRVISLLEGGYDTSPYSLGLARCVDSHVSALQQLRPQLV